MLPNLCKQEKTGLDNFILGKSLDGNEEKDFNGGKRGVREGSVTVVLAADAGKEQGSMCRGRGVG